MRTPSIARTVAALTALAGLLLAPAALAGPPLLCWPYDTGSAATLPMAGGSWHDVDKNMSAARVESETLALLTPRASVLARMETLRRAAVYCSKDETAAASLVRSLQARVSEAGARDGLALFDAGYFIEACKQTEWGWKSSGPITRLDGYTMVLKAIASPQGDPSMQFAAALMTGEHSSSKVDRKAQAQHVRAALEGAPEGSLLAKNLVSHAFLLNLKGATLDELKHSAAID